MFPDHEYTFKHALTHQVAYGTILQDRRRALHGHIVRAIERLHTDLPDDEIPALANHAMRGELWEEAVTYHRRAGRRAVARCANREAVTHFEEALVALERLPESRQRLERAFDLRLDVRTPLWLLGEMDRALVSLREAEQLARALGDEARTGWVSVYLFNICWMMGQPHEARVYAERAESAGDAVADRDLQLFASVSLVQLHLTSGNYREAQRVAEHGLELQEGGVPLPEGTYTISPLHNGRLHALLGFAKACLGQFDEGIAIGLVGLRESEASEYQFNIMYALTMLDRSYRLRGEFAQSEGLLDRTFRLMEEHGLTVQRAQHLASRGEGYLHCGRVAEGVALLEEALKAAKAKKVMFDLAQILLYLAEGYLVADRAEEALPCAREALRLAHERAERIFEAWALHLIGEIVSGHESHDLDTCETHYQDAIRLFEEIGARPWLARCHLGFGAFYRRIGRRQEAEGHLIRAVGMFGQMGMRYWLERAEREMNSLG